MDMPSDKDKSRDEVCIGLYYARKALIKEDIKSNHISMVNWADYNYIAPVIFGICHKDDDNLIIIFIL